MGAHKGAARVGGCLVPLENNLFVGPFSPSCGEGEAFPYRGHYLFCAIFSVRGGGGGGVGFFSLCAEFFWRLCRQCNSHYLFAANIY